MNAALIELAAAVRRFAQIDPATLPRLAAGTGEHAGRLRRDAEAAEKVLSIWLCNLCSQAPRPATGGDVGPGPRSAGRSKEAMGPAIGPDG